MRRILAVALGAFLAVLTGVVAPGAAVAAPIPQPSCDANAVRCDPYCANDTTRSQAAACNDVVVRHNDRVQHHPLIYLVAWGSKWTSDPYNIRGTVSQFMSHLAGTQWNNILSDYSDGTDYVHNDVRVGAPVFTDTTSPIPPAINMIDISDEALHAISSQHWTVTVDTQVLVMPQQGTIYSTGELTDIAGCGQHMPSSNNNVVVSVIVYQPDSPCLSPVGGDTNGMQQAFTSVAAHEYAESATDPTGPAIRPGTWGWSTDNPWNDPIEVGDKCQAYPLGVTNDPHLVNNPNNWSPPRLWDIYQQTCSQAHGQEFTSPDTTAPYTGVHTVEGGILNLYQANSGYYRRYLGAPLTEEQDIAPGGRVSYFQGLNYCGGGPTFNGHQSGSAIYAGPPGVFEIDGCLYHRYVQLGQTSSDFRFPVSNVVPQPGGYVSYFSGYPCTRSGPRGDNSAIYNSSNGTFFVRGCIYQHYRDLGQNTSPLGYPVTDEQEIRDGADNLHGWVSRFEGVDFCGGGPDNSGSAIYSKNGTTSQNYEVQGCIYAHYENDMGGPLGHLGFPVTDQRDIHDSSGNLYGWVSYFEGQNACGGGPNGSGSAIYSRNGYDRTFTVQGCIYAKYVSLGETRELGFPTTDEFQMYNNAGSFLGWVSYFDGQECALGGPDGSGSAIFSRGQPSNTHKVQGCIYAKYITVGGVTGPLGFPVTDEYGLSDGSHESDFENGYIHDSPSGQITCVLYSGPTC